MQDKEIKILTDKISDKILESLIKKIKKEVRTSQTIQEIKNNFDEILHEEEYIISVKLNNLIFKTYGSYGLWSVYQQTQYEDFFCLKQNLLTKKVALEWILTNF